MSENENLSSAQCCGECGRSAIDAALELTLCFVDSSGRFNAKEAKEAKGYFIDAYNQLTGKK